MIKAQFSLEDLPDMSPRYNIAPSQEIVLVLQTADGCNHGQLFTWGLVPFFAKDKKITPPLINARAETIAVKPAFRSAFKDKRGLVIMNGFYEWHVTSGKKQPFYISQKQKKLLAVAAIWENWISPENEVVHSCCLITSSANSVLEQVHTRMPVILNEEQQKIWLDNTHFDKEQLISLLNPYSNTDLTLYPVTPKMNNWRFTNIEAIQPCNDI